METNTHKHTHACGHDKREFMEWLSSVFLDDKSSKAIANCGRLKNERKKEAKKQNINKLTNSDSEYIFVIIQYVVEVVTDSPICDDQ